MTIAVQPRGFRPANEVRVGYNSEHCAQAGIDIRLAACALRRGDRPKRRKFITLVESVASVAVIALLVLAFPSSANAQQPPWKGCYAVDKREYYSAKKQKLLHARGVYVRTGRLWRRYYWYCP